MMLKRKVLCLSGLTILIAAASAQASEVQLRALMEDIRYGEADTFDLVCRRFGFSESASAPIVERAIGRVEWHIGPDAPCETMWHESDLIEDAQRLIRWGESLVTRCPNGVVAHQLQALVAMSREDLGRYVARALG